MKQIKKETPHIFVRISDYEKYDYIEEHNNILKKEGYVWLLKIGKTINRKYLSDVVKSNGGIILKTTAKKGNKFYYADLLDTDINNDDNPIYPKYYDEYLYYSGYDISYAKENGFWFKISNLREISNDIVSKFILNGNKKEMLDYAINTRVVHMYVSNKEDINI